MQVTWEGRARWQSRRPGPRGVGGHGYGVGAVGVGSTEPAVSLVAASHAEPVGAAQACRAWRQGETQQPRQSAGTGRQAHACHVLSKRRAGLDALPQGAVSLAPARDSHGPGGGSHSMAVPGPPRSVGSSAWQQAFHQVPPSTMDRGDGDKGQQRAGEGSGGGQGQGQFKTPLPPSQAVTCGRSASEPGVELGTRRSDGLLV